LKKGNFYRNKLEGGGNHKDQQTKEMKPKLSILTAKNAKKKAQSTPSRGSE